MIFRMVFPFLMGPFPILKANLHSGELLFQKMFSLHAGLQHVKCRLTFANAHLHTFSKECCRVMLGR